MLVASGLIAGEALAGLVIGWFNYQYGKLPTRSSSIRRTWWAWW